MKKIITILLLTSSLFSFAQGPIVLGTYLPVRGTAVKEVWDISTTNIAVPAGGQNVTWDYIGKFLHPSDTFKIKTFHPDSTAARYHHYFPTATHASFLRTPLNNLSDSIYSYYIIDAAGLHNLGGFNIKAQIATNFGYDTTAIMNPGELYVPSVATYGMVKNDTSKYVTYGKFNNFPIKIKGTKFKEMIGYGYGTLKLPNGSIYTNVLLAKQNVRTVDSAFSAGSNSFLTILSTKFIDYSFIRNNTFGSSYLMYLNADSTNTIINNGWYTLPVDFGSISGLVVDSVGGAPTTHGEALLYRENSNFARNDILDRSLLDQNGHYQFDSIPFGEYRIAIRADSSVYPNALTTYYGDSTNWQSAPSIHTTAPSTPVGLIHLQYHPVPSGSGIVHGHIGFNSHIRIDDPIPGIDIIVRKNPGGIILEVKTDSSIGNRGNFTLSALNTGNYTMFVDMPGLYMANGCNFTIGNGTIINGFDCTVGTDSIHPTYGILSVNEPFRNDNLMSVYPNPYSSSTTIQINVSEKSDVLLEVYNLLGMKVQTMEKAEKGPGIYSYYFNSKNIKHASGVYILKLNVGSKTSILKIIEQ